MKTNKTKYYHDPLAQLVEHLTFNQGVGRSSRPWVTNRNFNRSDAVFLMQKIVMLCSMLKYSSK